MKKIGFIFECQKDGPDMQVYFKPIKRLIDGGHIPAFEPIPYYESNKKQLISNCGETAKDALNEDNCDHIFICWDLQPGWVTKPLRACRKQDRERIFESLNASTVPVDLVTPLCIKYMLESWLISDSRAFLELPHAIGRVPSQPNADASPKPKDVATNITAKVGLTDIYNDYKDAPILAEHVRLNRLSNSESFCRLLRRLRRQLDVPTNAVAELCPDVV